MCAQGDAGEDGGEGDDGDWQQGLRSADVQGHPGQHSPTQLPLHRHQVSQSVIATPPHYFPPR